MADSNDYENLLDYEEEEEVCGHEDKQEVKGHYVSIHSSGFRDFLLKPELLRAISDCGFEHPSEIQHECIPQALLGLDGSWLRPSLGWGRLLCLCWPHCSSWSLCHGHVLVLVMCHTRELAFQICKEYHRFSKFLPDAKVAVFFGGVSVSKDEAVLRDNCPHIVVGTPGRILALVRTKKLLLNNLKHFVLDECDKMLEVTEMRHDVQQIFRATPHDKQVIYVCILYNV